MKACCRRLERLTVDWNFAFFWGGSFSSIATPFTIACVANRLFALPIALRALASEKPGMQRGAAQGFNRSEEH